MCWNQPHSNYRSTPGLQTNKLVECNQASVRNHHTICRSISPNQFIPRITTLTNANALSKENPVQISVRYMSRKTVEPKLDFSTFGGVLRRKSTTTINKEQDNKAVKVDSLSQKARLLFKKYGSVFVGSYLTIYVTTLFTFFVFFDSGLVHPEDFTQILKMGKDIACETADAICPAGTKSSMNEAADSYAEEMATEMTQDKRTLVDIAASYLQKWEWTHKYADKLSENPHLANFAVAWFIVKFTEPIRLTATIIVTPKVAKAIGLKALANNDNAMGRR